MRFIVNLPKEELESVERICFQIEEAQWFYEDFIRPLDPNLPTLNLRQFCLRIFRHCPLLSGWSHHHHSAAFSEFLAYKTRVPVRGAIMLNASMDEVVLVKGWKKGANWSFPRGKINKDEKDLACAVREVYEETGFDIHAAGLAGTEEGAFHIEMTMREQHMRLYVFRDVPKDTHFEPRTRKEISKVQWYRLSELPTLKKTKQLQQGGGTGDLAVNANRFYMVAPFLMPLKKWISKQKKLGSANVSHLSGVGKILKPTEAAGGGSISYNRPTTAPPVDDISRLMARLRQSRQAPTISDLPELSGPVETANEASSHLKDLLHVQSKPIVIEQRNERPLEPGVKAQAMLSLLRSGYRAESEQFTQPVQLPQTPLNHITGKLPMPSSPAHHTHQPDPASLHAPPPSFPSSLTNTGKHSAQPLSRSARHIPTTQSHPLITQRPPALAFHSPVVAPQESRYTSQQRAPYQRTMDPLSYQGAQQPPNQTTSVPPANTLPPPKLSAHSSALLNIFKTGVITKPLTVPSASEGGLGSQAATRAPELHQIRQSESMSTHSNQQVVVAGDHSDQPEVAVIQPITAPDPFSHQQRTLLKLFQSKPVLTMPKTTIVSPSLMPPSTPVELSAQSSPSHSRVTSLVSKGQHSISPKSSSNGQNSTVKGSTALSRNNPVPVSATVTGPLNVHQFEKTTKKTTGLRFNSGSSAANKKKVVSTIPPLRPFKILARPTPPAQSNRTSNEHESAASAVPLLKPSLGPQDRDNKLPKKDLIATTFYPQILQRAGEAASKPQQILARSPISVIVEKNEVMQDGRFIQSQDQRDALLSLLSKSQPMLKSPNSEATTIGTPMVEQRAQQEVIAAPPSSILTHPRVGSLNSISATGEELTKPNNGRQTPKPSPIDKKFLLSFLDGVVKEGMS